MFCVYIIQSEKDGSYYIGHTEDVEKRLSEHNAFNGRYTSSKKPWKIVYREKLLSKAEAAQREREIKKKKSRRYIEFLINSSVG